MAVRHVTTDDIKVFNQRYYECHNFAQIARETGFSSSTVSKYVDKNWVPVAPDSLKHISLADVPEFDPSIFDGVENYGELCNLSDEERAEMEELWKEMEV